MRNLLLVIFTFAMGFSSQSQNSIPDLTFIYWMPYDNNLSNWADSIYSMIQTNLSTNRIVATVQKDVTNHIGMTRSILTQHDITNEPVATELSSSGKAFNQYLQWVGENVPSKKYAIIFLDHGGKLDEIGLDENPGESFLRVDSANWAIKNFNTQVGRKTELIFLQVCTKGSIEPIFELKDAAEFTMFSQTTLGAPNYYYENFFKALSSKDLSPVNGHELAELITAHERLDMYESLVCVDNSKFDEFIGHFDDFITNYSSITDYQINNNLLLFYYGQTYFDLRTFIKSFQGIDTTSLIESLNELIVMNKINPNNSSMQGYSGLSLLAPQKDYLEHLQDYQHLKFFQRFKMEPFFVHSRGLIKD